MEVRRIAVGRLIGVKGWAVPEVLVLVHDL